MWLKTIPLALVAMAALTAGESKPVTEENAPREAPETGPVIVEARDKRVDKNEKLDHTADPKGIVITVANDVQSIEISGDNLPFERRVKVLSKAFLPPGGMIFVVFPTPTWYGKETRVDVEKDSSIFAYRTIDQDQMIKVKAYVFQTDAADFPLRLEGNLGKPATGAGSSGSSGTSTPAANPQYPEHWAAKVDAFKPQIRTDFNRDGVISFTSAVDETSPTKPFRFWTNEDFDLGDANGGDSLRDRPDGPVAVPTYMNISTLVFKIPRTTFTERHIDHNTVDDAVNGHKDAIDFFPVAIRIENMDKAKSIAYETQRHLKFRIAHGQSPAREGVRFKICRARNVKAANTRGYREDTDLAPSAIRTYGRAMNSVFRTAPVEPLPPGTQLGRGFVLSGALRDDFLRDNELVLLLEATPLTDTNPPRTIRELELRFEVYFGDSDVGEIKSSDVLAGRDPLHLSLSSVSEMYRWLNLRDERANWGPPCDPAEIPSYRNESSGIPVPERLRADRTGEPANFPDRAPYANDKWLVWAHGFNTSADEGGGVSDEMFKRFFWSGSNARFVGVTWFADGKDLLGGTITVSKLPPFVSEQLGFPQFEVEVPVEKKLIPSFPLNMYHAYQTRDYLIDKLKKMKAVPEKTSFIGHSQGNVLLAAAACNPGYANPPPTFLPAYFAMLNAALPEEVLIDNDSYTKYDDFDPNPTGAPNDRRDNAAFQMVAYDYRNIAKELHANHIAATTIRVSNDRLKPTWRGLFIDLQQVPRLENYWTRHDEVLENWRDLRQGVNIFGTLAWDYRVGLALPITRRNVWYYGQTSIGALRFPGTEQLYGARRGGWGLNDSLSDIVKTNIPSNQDMIPGSPFWNNDETVFNPLWRGAPTRISQISNVDTRWRVLTESIPALTRAIGGNHGSLMLKKNKDKVWKVTEDLFENTLNLALSKNGAISHNPDPWQEYFRRPSVKQSSLQPRLEWPHATILYSSYAHCYPLFQKIVVNAGLR